MTRRSIILYFILAFFLLLLGVSVFRIKQKQDFKQSIAGIPDFCLPQVADSVLFCHAQLVEDKPVVLLYLHPECNMCRMEALQIQQKADDTGSIQWILVSYVEQDSLNKFTATYRLDSIPGLTVLMDTKLILYNRLQVKGIPSCYIYNSRHRLVKVMQGIEKLEKVIRLANQ